MKLTDQIVTRDRSIDYNAFGLMLPNPDPILKAQGQDIRIYRDLRSDAHLGGCVRRRKSAVKALEWGLDRDKAKSRIAKNIEAIFRDLDMDRIIGEITDAPLYGYQPLEITWQRVGGLVVPANLEGKPPEWFCYGRDNRLRFRTKARPFEGEELPDRKFIVARQDATYANPYGFPDLSMCFWPIVFKKGGVKFWVNFAEKYGTPWAIGKLPRGTPQTDIDAMADQLDAMIQDAVAVVPDDGSVELVEAAGKAASADLYERLVMYCRSEVSIALTGTNQTVEASSNRASATAGLEVADDLRDGDAEIVSAALNQLIRWTCEINWGSGERPVFSMWDQKAQDVTRVKRDETIAKAGAKLTNAYWVRAYGFQPGDLAPEAAASVGAPGESAAQFAERESSSTGLPAAHHTPLIRGAGGVAFPDQTALDALPDPDAAVLDSILAPIVEALAAGHSPEELIGQIAEWYPRMDDSALTELLARAMFVAELHGRYAARQERSDA